MLTINVFIGLLDDLDKELNNYVMRCREWYGWHFPELGKLVTDNLVYAKTVKVIGVKENCADIDLSAILPEEIEAEVKEMAEVSMGTEVHKLSFLTIIYVSITTDFTRRYRQHYSFV